MDRGRQEEFFLMTGIGILNCAEVKRFLAASGVNAKLA
jgi:hypothetical protein